MYSLEGDVEDVSRQHIANRASLLVHPAPWYIGLRRSSYFLAAEAGLEHGGRGRRARRQGGAGRDGDGHADAGAVEQRPPRRGQRVLHLGHRAQGSAGGIVDDHDRRRARAADRAAAKRRLLRPRSDRARHEQALRGDADLVLRARRRLHRLGAVRPQPHRARARAPHLQARRHRADHDPVAVGTGDRARDDRARRRALAPPVRADLDAAVDLGSDHRRGHSERVRVGPARQGTQSGRGEAGRAHRHAAVRARRQRPQRGRGSVGSWQAVVPPRLRRAEGRGCHRSG